MFGYYIKFVNNCCIELGDQIIEFLIESLQGPCLQNQLELSKNKIVDLVKIFIAAFKEDIDYKQRGFQSRNDRNEINAQITKSIALLNELLEGNTN